MSRTQSERTEYAEAEDPTLSEARSRICDAFLLALAIVTVPNLAFSLYRTVEFGWQPIMALHLLLAGLLWLITLFRRRLPYAVRAGYVIAMFLIVGLGGIWMFGLVAGSIPWLVVAPIMGAVFFDFRGGLLTLLAIGLVAAAIGAATVTGHRVPAFDVAAYIDSPTVWTVYIVNWIFLGGCMVFAFGAFNRHLVHALETSHQRAKALRQGEREYRNILDNMMDTFYRADREGRIVMASPSTMDLMGYTPEELIGQNLADFYVNPEMRLAFLEQLEAGGGRVSNFEAEIRHKSGAKVWVATNARYWTDGDGGILGVEGLIRDITAHQHAEQTLRRSQKMEAVGQLTGGIAHDYNNMLGVIMGNIELVGLSADLDEKSRERLESAYDAARRNADLTNKLLGFSSLKPSGTQLTALNDSIVKLTDVVAKSLTVSIEVEHDLADDLWLVDINKDEFEDMILNLSLNARDAMPDGGTITFETTNKILDDDYVRHNPGSRAGAFVMVAVSDTGCGMSEEVRERAFEPFFSTKEAGQGSGLGLSMVYAFVQRSGGHIKIYSEPGNGTTFQAFLPRAAAAAEEPADADADGETAIVGGTETILVVDDEPDLVEVAVSYLESLGYRAKTAGNGKEALEAFDGHTDIDLLFSDIVMPGGIDGYRLAEAARRQRPGLRVLLTSGFSKGRGEASDENDTTVADLAARRLRKPYTRAELAAAVRRTLDKAD